MGVDDNWSLKDIYKDSWEFDDAYYSDDDLETLRLKLIEDLYSIMKEDIERITLSYRGYPDLKPMPEIRMTVTESLNKIERIINKRFGVE
jgi:hypothetical protein